jgi:hypothetical protein
MKTPIAPGSLHGMCGVGKKYIFSVLTRDIFRDVYHHTSQPILTNAVVESRFKPCSVLTVNFQIQPLECLA